MSDEDELPERDTRPVVIMDNWQLRPTYHSVEYSARAYENGEYPETQMRFERRLTLCGRTYYEYRWREAAASGGYAFIDKREMRRDHATLIGRHCRRCESMEQADVA